jgi:hypothetical protein
MIVVVRITDALKNTTFGMSYKEKQQKEIGRGEGRDQCVDRTCFIHFHELQNYRNCLHSVTLVT